MGMIKVDTGNLISIDSSSDWTSRLATSGKPPNDRPIPNLDNCLIAFEYAPDWRGVMAWDTFAHHTVILRRPPWGGQANRVWTERDDILAMRWMQQHGIQVLKSTVQDAVASHSQNSPVNPLTDYLSGLEWDGEQRINTVLRDYFGVKHNDYSCAVGRAWLVSAVARAFQPGCKADHCIILEGREGIKKSSALKVLAGKDWFTDHVPKDLAKETAMHLQGIWVVEFGELEGIGSSDNKAESVKAFLSQTTDRYRPPYSRRVIQQDRQFICTATTNKDVYLPSEDGNRRLWPVTCEHIDIAGIVRDRDQLWAEAVVLYNQGEPWHLPKWVEQLAHKEQAARYEADPWQDRIAKFLSGRKDISISEILEKSLDKKVSDWTTRDQMRVARCLKALGWEQYRMAGTGARRYRPTGQ